MLFLTPLNIKKCVDEIEISVTEHYLDSLISEIG